MSPASYQTAPPRDVCFTAFGRTASGRSMSQRLESGKRDSNPRPQPWQGCALPTELFPRTVRILSPTGPAQRLLARVCSADSGNGGEGDRTPDLVNAIHALSQLSYAPVIYCRALDTAPRQHGNLARARVSVKRRRMSPAMNKKKAEPSLDPPKRVSQRPASRPRGPAPRRPHHRRNPRPVAPPAKPRRPRKRDTAKSLGVYDADRDILDQYLYEVSKTPLLTPPQEIAIARKVRAGDDEAMQELVKRNLRFVISVAKKYQNRGLALTDLIGEGNVGLLTAARKFDPDQGVKFISYAVWWIRQAILAALARHGRTVRVPLNRTADLSRIIRTAETLRQDLRREPTPRGDRGERPVSRSTWCSRSRRSTPPTSGWTLRSTPRATAP